MKKNRFATIVVPAALLFAAIPGAGQTSPERYRTDFKEARSLYERGMYDRAIMLFDALEDTEYATDAAAYKVLCAVNMKTPGYGETINDFLETHPTSPLVSRIRFEYALNLFDDKDYRGASAQFELLSRHNVYKSEVPEFLFKKAYCDFALGRLDRAVLRFKDLEMRAHSDYTAPARYTIGYIYYGQADFRNAVEWLEKASEDARFKEISAFYLLESRFMLKEYGRVKVDGPALLEKVPKDRKEHVARIISESCLVLGDVENARKYFDMSDRSEKQKTRSDYFYAGSVLYATKDYQGAIDNFSKMTSRTDSLGQIANYHLGYSYIKTKNKVAALAAFREASEPVYNPDIREDAFFNYAKLSFDLNTDSSVFGEYLALYTDKGKREQIYSYIAIAALYNRDYAGAIEAYDKIDELDQDMKSNYMKANYLRAYQLIRKGSYRNAVPCLKAAAYYSDRRTYFNQMSRYWLAEAYYRSGQYAEARSAYTDLYNTSALYGTAESYLIPYNIGYCHFKENNFEASARWFSDYLSGKQVSYRKEAGLRLGDSRFMLQQYKEAGEAYDKVLKDYFNINDIYPYYQAALAHGLAGDKSRKISLLENVLKASPSSQFYPEAMYELGRAYISDKKDDNAVSCFTTLASNTKDSTIIAKSYIELGMIYRNMSDNEKALAYYKKVVEEMPVTEFADAAILSIESIYKTMNEPESYLAYIESIGKSSLKTEDEKEMMIFNAAEQIFLSENYQKALVSLQSYIGKYPEGKMLPNAEYYMAESYKNLGQPEKACDHYRNVITSGSGSIAELSLLNYSVLSYSLQKFSEAYEAYSSLYETAKLPNNKFAALTGMMKSAYKAHKYDEAINSASLLKEDSKTDEDLAREADYIMARSYLATSRRDEAFAVLARLSAHPLTPEGAEASYMIIQDSYDRGDFQSVEDKVYAFSDSSTGQTYWLAKAFVVLGDAFVEKGDLEQAKATFESVAQGYRPEKEDDDIIASVNSRLEKLQSMIQENANSNGNEL